MPFLIADDGLVGLRFADIPGAGLIGRQIAWSRRNVGRHLSPRRLLRLLRRRPVKDPAEGPPRLRRGVGFWISHAPATLRALVRTDEMWLSVLAALVGAMSGLCVVAMGTITHWMHRVLFGIGVDDRLSSQVEVSVGAALLVPTIGGLLLGLSGLALARWWPQRTIDAIEANALHGGRMSVNASLVVVGQTMWSNGVGASVGLEAGYTQIGAALASRLGRSFRVRRNDLRLLVGCGAAAAIAAAFNAPLAGAFYAFELVIGTYTLAALAPVIIASIVAVSLSRVLMPHEFTFDLRMPLTIDAVNYMPVLVLGVVCALAGIAIMRGVTLTEEVFRKSRVPVWLRPAIGGLAVGMLALITPQVLSAGHGALQVDIEAVIPLGVLLGLILLKSVASAISLGSGFRGGLFFASLLLGALLGKAFAAALALVTTVYTLPSVVGALVGMSALAVAIVGGPLTMAFLALETTASLPLTVAVLAASVVSSLTVRRIFGYSFATWRFHLRGEAIRSAVDIGWMRNLTVGRMMRRELRTVRGDTQLASFRRDFPLGLTDRVVVLDDGGKYAGIALVAEAHTPTQKAVGPGTGTIMDILHNPNDMLAPQMTIKEAVALFETVEADALAVVDSIENRRVIGVLTEQHALRRYSEELERRRRELSGE